MSIDRRREILRNLISLHGDLDENITLLRQFPWDSEELVQLGPVELSGAMNRFLSGNITADQLETWANAVEVRDDILFTPPESIEIVTELANPLLFHPLNQKSVKDLLARLPKITP